MSRNRGKAVAGPNYREEIDYDTVESGEISDELSLWSAPFALQMLDRVPVRDVVTGSFRMRFAAGSSLQAGLDRVARAEGEFALTIPPALLEVAAPSGG